MSDKQKEYIDKGVAYTFNRIALVEAMSNQADENGKKIPKTAFRTRIAEKLDVTPDAVKNWELGKNFPSRVRYLKVCAEELGIDYKDLLTPLQKEETKTLNDIEVELIKRVFADCVECFYEYSTIWDDYENGTNKGVFAIKEHRNALKTRLSNLHVIVDKEALNISDSVRYRLHRILNDISGEDSIIDGNYPRRWEEGDPSLWSRINPYLILHITEYASREDFILDSIESWSMDIFGAEQVISAKMDYTYSDIPDWYDEGQDPTEEQKQNIVKVGCNEFEFSLPIVFRDLLTRLLKTGFGIDFPEMRINYKENH